MRERRTVASAAGTPAAATVHVDRPAAAPNGGGRRPSIAAIAAPQLHDDEVVLRLPSPADVHAIVDACQDETIARWTRVPSPYTEEDARRFVLMAIGALAEGTGVHLVVHRSEAPDVLVGCVGVSVEAADLTGELGYWVVPTARGRGVATRAARLLARFAFDELDLRALHLQAAVTNEASNAVARALGFRHVGVLRSAMIVGPSGAAGSPRSDANVYDLLPDELTSG